MSYEAFEVLRAFFDRDPGLVLLDCLDIALVAYLIYRVLALIKGTRAMQMAIGLALVFAVQQLARRFGLITLWTILNSLLTYIVLIIVVIFQNDIRRALMRVGRRPFFQSARTARETHVIEEVIKAAAQMAQKRIGALIVFERDAMLDEFIEPGIDLDSSVTKELLVSLFIPSFENPTHDGAVIIRDGRIWQAGAFLPLTASPKLDRALGTRHRAALGISEETDTVVVVVSEERGAMSLCFNGNIVRDLEPASLREALIGLFYRKSRRRREEGEGRSSATPPPPPPPEGEVEAVADGTANPEAGAAPAEGAGPDGATAAEAVDASAPGKGDDPDDTGEAVDDVRAERGGGPGERDDALVAVGENEDAVGPTRTALAASGAKKAEELGMTARTTAGRALRKALTENVGLKIISLVAAIVLFSLVRGSEDAQRSVFVDVVATLPSPASGKILIGEIPDKVKVTLRGSRSLLNSIGRNEARAHPESTCATRAGATTTSTPTSSTCPPACRSCSSPPPRFRSPGRTGRRRRCRSSPTWWGSPAAAMQCTVPSRSTHR